MTDAAPNWALSAQPVLLKQTVGLHQEKLTHRLLDEVGEGLDVYISLPQGRDQCSPLAT